MIVEAQWLRIWVPQYGGPWFERCMVSFFNIFHSPFYPMVTVLLEYFDPAIDYCAEVNWLLFHVA